MNNNPLEKYVEKEYSGGRERFHIDEFKLNLISKLYDQDVLDIGCGCGVISKELLNNENRVWGLDFSETAVKKAKGKGVNAVKCDIEKTFHFKRKFDCIIMFDILEHVLDPIGLLDRSYNLLKDDGVLLITIPNDMSLAYKLSALLGISFQEKIYYNNNFAEHHTIFSERLAKIILDKSKFSNFNITKSKFVWKYLCSPNIIISCRKCE